MRGLAVFALVVGLGLVGQSPVLAQSDPCTAFKWSVAREQQAFAADLPAVASGAAYPAPGQGVVVALLPLEQVSYKAPPTRKPKSAPAFGAELTATIAEAGAYQVTLSDEAWVDLVQDGQKLKSSGFSGKMGCQGVRKTVKFTLVPGPLTIEISDAAAASVKMDVLASE